MSENKTLKSDANSIEPQVRQTDAIEILSKLQNYFYDLKLNRAYSFEAVDKALRLEKGTTQKYLQEVADEIDCDVKFGPRRFELKARPTRPAGRAR